MIAAVLHGPRDLRLQSRPALEPGVGEAVIRVEAAGLCGTDHRIWTGDRTVEYPRVMGHEFIGTVLAVGSGVDGLGLGVKVAARCCWAAPAGILDDALLLTEPLAVVVRAVRRGTPDLGETAPVLGVG